TPAAKFLWCLNASRRCLMGTLSAKKLNEINKSPNSERFRPAPRTCRPLFGRLHGEVDPNLKVSRPPLQSAPDWSRSEGGVVMGNSVWRNYLTNPHEFDGWIEANAVLGSI